MKQLFFLSLGALLFACNVQDKKAGAAANAADASVTDSTKFTTIQWIDSTRQNLGNLTEGQVVEISWRFKNTGSKPLVIQSVRPGCGCTVAEEHPEPVAPGAEGVIKAKFNSDGHPGHADKYITVQANLLNNNSGNTTQLNFTADVKPKS